ncbi:hypothetical protein AB3K25_09295 [Leuconostoc sp. MS02]|uniref:Uncharacterized protein n=1 Tax=Leuconostoc aquikimchii TaxID=3236804 RepID=A0ABV3S1H7_9LACO
MDNKRRNHWGRDEFQVAKTGGIDTRGLYIAMSSIIALVGISLFDINWADTKTQMIFVIYILLIHQAIEQTLGLTDTYLLKMSTNQQLLFAVVMLILGMFYLCFCFSTNVLVNRQITFEGMFNMMNTMFLFCYALTVLFVVYREKKSIDGES